ncbi:arylamine N-acetyltransferase [Nocardioides marinquilinus]|uniref:Arylamine N-acetyltransferase n=1 Tax=Nocardioides marinquilinus TaxID=1210400 RepID=A0ABP9PX84_9ACTN
MAEVVGYLRLLGLDADPAGLPPTLDTLRRVHRAHLLALPYDNLDIMLGRPPAVTPDGALAHVVRTGRAGYCFGHNGTLEAVLTALGFDVGRRHGRAWLDPSHRASTDLNHLALVVGGLPTAAHPAGTWWADVGLGEGFLEPLPLRAGAYDDGPLRYRVEEVRDDGWVFAHDPRGSFAGVETRDLPVDDDAVAAAHAGLATPPEGRFTTKLVVIRRRADGVAWLRGCVRGRIDAAGVVHRDDLTDWTTWRETLDDLGLAVADVERDHPGDLPALFERSLAAHRAWDAAGRP